MTVSPADPQLPGLATTGSATLSEDKAYCYLLTRRWRDHGAPAIFVLLHPTMADASTDDATVRRCVALAHEWGCSGANLANLYAFRTARRDWLWNAAEPVGPDADLWLQRQFYVAAMIDAPLVAAWGAHAPKDRVAHVLRLPGADRLMCLGTNADGSPVHPTHAEGSHLSAWRPT